MSNILNSQNLNINNNIAAKKLEKQNTESRYIEAPQSIPKYSIDKALKEKDEFRKSVMLGQSNQQSKSKKAEVLKFGLIAAVVAGLAFLIKKK